MTDEEKIEEMFPFYEDMDDYEFVQTIFKRKGAMEMAEWKDKQFAEEKKDLRSLVDMLPMNENNQTIIEDLIGLLK